MQFAREAQRLVIGFTVLFVLVAIVAAYWVITGPETILTRDDNGRLFAAESAIRRGAIYDRHGEPLVNSVVDAGNVVSRIYLHPETFGVTGYYSLQYGVGGAEAAFDEVLRGDDLNPASFDRYWSQNILHNDQQGSEIRLTIDTATQARIVEAMNGVSGGAVVISVPDGEIIALVSLPTFDPNTLDENWDELALAEEKPFFNRVLQANYQPGGIFQLVLMAAARPNNIPLTFSFDDANRAIPIDGSSIACLRPMPSANTTLQEAFLSGCAAPFVEVANQLGEDKIMQTIGSLFPALPITLDNFVDDTPTNLPELSQSIFLYPTLPVPNEATYVENALGQGETNITVISIAEISAAILNNGNAPQPQMLQAIRPPDEEDWQNVTTATQTIPLMTSATAQQLLSLMIESGSDGTAQSAAQGDETIGGHAAIALSGEQTLSWFTGFIMTDTRRGYAVALVLEDTDDYALAAEIGGIALRSAAEITDD
ncbi:MAG: penicillin-binding transpeptidase domain-containing protein [Aggregatilineales bacterium]